MLEKRVVWEKLTLTVGSGASDTVVPPRFYSCSTIFHTEYDVVNGDLVHNLGERRCTILVGKDVGELIIAFKVVEVHKPLLAVRSLTAQGRRVILADQDDHILLSGNQKFPLRNVNRVFELDFRVKRDRDSSAVDLARQDLQH